MSKEKDSKPEIIVPNDDASSQEELQVPYDKNLEAIEALPDQINYDKFSSEEQIRLFQTMMMMEVQVRLRTEEMSHERKMELMALLAAAEKAKAAAEKAKAKAEKEKAEAEKVAETKEVEAEKAKEAEAVAKKAAEEAEAEAKAEAEAAKAEAAEAKAEAAEAEAEAAEAKAEAEAEAAKAAKAKAEAEAAKAKAAKAKAKAEAEEASAAEEAVEAAKAKAEAEKVAETKQAEAEAAKAEAAEAKAEAEAAKAEAEVAKKAEAAAVRRIFNIKRRIFNIKKRIENIVLFVTLSTAVTLGGVLFFGGYNSDKEFQRERTRNQLSDIDESPYKTDSNTPLYEDIQKEINDRANHYVNLERRIEEFLGNHDHVQILDQSGKGDLFVWREGNSFLVNFDSTHIGRDEPGEEFYRGGKSAAFLHLQMEGSSLDKNYAKVNGGWIDYKTGSATLGFDEDADGKVDRLIDEDKIIAEEEADGSSVLDLAIKRIHMKLEDIEQGRTMSDKIIL